MTRTERLWSRRERAARLTFYAWVALCVLGALYGLSVVHARTVEAKPSLGTLGGLEPLSGAQSVKISTEATAHVFTTSQKAQAPEWRSARVSWYGPGFYGRHTASGAVLTQGMMNVAHRSLPFGTRIVFEYQGRTCTAVVNDRGPFIDGRLFDLGPGTAQALGFSGAGTVRWRFAR